MILVQLGFYVNSHAEYFKDTFVLHDGKMKVVAVGELPAEELEDGPGLLVEEKRPVVPQRPMTGAMLENMGKVLHDNIKDEALREWIIPDFSTTTDTDKVTASVLMLGMLQKDFTMMGKLGCGLPTVTLLGEKDDWLKLRVRASKISEFGKEARIWFILLKPVLDRFVRSFERPESAEIKSFWDRMVHHVGRGSGPSFYSGWLTAFMFWDDEGKSLYEEGLGPINRRVRGREPRRTELDGAKYHTVESTKIPKGYTSLPMHIQDNTKGRSYYGLIVAGSVGWQLTISKKLRDSGVCFHEVTIHEDTLQPHSGWFLVELGVNRTEDMMSMEEYVHQWEQMGKRPARCTCLPPCSV